MKKKLLCFSPLNKKVHYYVLSRLPSAAKPACAKAVVVTCRSRPSASSSSYVLAALVEAFVSAEPCAGFLRDTYCLIVVPLLNPDGLVLGNYSKTVSGHLQELLEDKNLGPELFYLKRLLLKLRDSGVSVELLCHLDDSDESLGCWAETSGPPAAFDRCAELFALLNEYGCFFNASNCKFHQSPAGRGETEPPAAAGSGIHEVLQRSGEAGPCLTVYTSVGGGRQKSFELEDYKRIGRSYCKVFASYLFRRELELDAHLVHLGTMGVYGYSRASSKKSSRRCSES